VKTQLHKTPTCSAVIPLMSAARTLSLLRLATAMFGNRYNISENSASRAMFNAESIKQK